jgi:hypothetical protein
LCDILKNKPLDLWSLKMANPRKQINQTSQTAVAHSELIRRNLQVLFNGDSLAVNLIGSSEEFINEMAIFLDNAMGYDIQSLPPGIIQITDLGEDTLEMFVALVDDLEEFFFGKSFFKDKSETWLAINAGSSYTLGQLDINVTRPQTISGSVGYQVIFTLPN